WAGSSRGSDMSSILVRSTPAAGAVQVLDDASGRDLAGALRDADDDIGGGEVAQTRPGGRGDLTRVREPTGTEGHSLPMPGGSGAGAESLLPPAAQRTADQQRSGEQVDGEERPLRGAGKVQHRQSAEAPVALRGPRTHTHPVEGRVLRFEGLPHDLEGTGADPAGGEHEIDLLLHCVQRAQQLTRLVAADRFADLDADR